jgi:hypothetical protein
MELIGRKRGGNTGETHGTKHGSNAEEEIDEIANVLRSVL